MQKKLSLIIQKALKTDLALELTIPERAEFGHYTTNIAMRLASERKENPRKVAEDIAAKIKESEPKLFERVEVAGPGFVNFWIAPEAVRKEFATVLKKKRTFGKSAIGKGKRVIVEYSQPNIAKPLHAGHLRNTILGDALANIHAFIGYKTTRWNYLGDWGTQFGKVIAAWKREGNEQELKKNPVEYLEKLYVEFGRRAKEDEELAASGREEFRKLEAGDKRNFKLWTRFKKESMKEIGDIYRTLGMHFDTYMGESSFRGDMGPLVKNLLDKGVAVRSEGAVIVPLEDFDLPPALIQKTDGASLYHTRDIAAFDYRIKKYHPDRFLYVVGNEQTLHFAQLLAILAKLGLGKGCETVHVKYGLLLGVGGKKMSTREGTAVSVRGIIENAVRLAGDIVAKKNPSIPERARKKVAHAVGVGALKYALLRENRMSDIVFDWNKMLDFTGDSAPYLQYTRARLLSIMRKAGRHGKGDLAELSGELDLALMRKIFEFPDEVERSGEVFSTNNLAQYLYDLAVLANRFYETTPILKDENKERRDARMHLIDMVSTVIERGLALFGIESPDNI